MTLKTRKCKGGFQFPATIQPRSSRNKICGFYNESLKISLTSPPVEGAANQDCVKFLAKQLGIRPAQVTIVAGQTSRKKTIRIEGLDEKEFINKLSAFLTDSGGDS